MAFSAVQKRDIRKYLGVAFGFYDLNTRLESMMDRIGSVAEDQAQVEAWLTELNAIETGQASTSSTAAATYGSLKKVDEVEFYQAEDGESSSTLSPIDRGRALIDRIARSFGVDDYLPNGDYFSSMQRVTRFVALG